MKKYSVLVVDDQTNWRDLLVDLLKDEFNVISVANYEDALKAVHNQSPPFHVVITDIRLADEEIRNEDGLRLIEYLNQSGEETNTIVITGYATISTARRALSTLAAYDYLEKRPSDGSPFDITGFQRIVYKAARDAEEQRFKGFTDISFRILVLEPNIGLGKKMEGVLEKDGYHVTVIQSPDRLETSPAGDDGNFALIFVRDTLYTDELFDILQHLYPDGKIIMLTSHDISGFADTMREFSVFLTFSMPDGQIDSNKLQDLVHSALTTRTTKYIFAQVNRPNQPNQVVTSGILGQTYHLNVSIHDTNIQRATSIPILLQEQKRGKNKLNLVVHATQMIVEPGFEAHWDIPLSIKNPHPFCFSIAPQATGQKDILIEIRQEGRWLGRITINFEIIENDHDV